MFLFIPHYTPTTSFAIILSAHKPYPGCSWRGPRGFRRRIRRSEFVSPLKFHPLFILSCKSICQDSQYNNNSVRPHSPANDERRVPRGLEDVSKYPALLAELLDSDRRWTEEDVKKLAGGNLLRVFREVERVCRPYLLAYISFLCPRRAKQ